MVNKKTFIYSKVQGSLKECKQLFNDLTFHYQYKPIGIWSWLFKWSLISPEKCYMIVGENKIMLISKKKFDYDFSRELSVEGELIE